MAKVLIFSRTFPHYHPRAGDPTHFVQKFWCSILKDSKIDWSQINIDEKYNFIMADHSPKKHTIRVGNRFKPGDFFTPRVWKSKPYTDKQIVICANVEVLKTYKFEIKNNGVDFSCYINDLILPTWMVERVALNDGLTLSEFYEWFKFPSYFSGQIIVWDKSIDYDVL